MIKKLIITSALAIVVVGTSMAQTRNKQLTLKDTIKDQSIHVPQELEQNLDHALAEWRKNYKKDPSCVQSGSYDLNLADSVYIQRLYSLPSEMELAYNPIVRSYIDMYAGRRKTSVEYMLTKGKYYFPLIEETLDRYGLPLELKFLPIIESALNPIAKSRAGATGLWQFMLRTGQMYDLEVNTLVDERKDPRKATEAAARYLRDLYNIYKDWNLVIAAYNCGPGNVNKAIRRSGGATDYWAIYPHLPRETRGYVPAFIAATYIMSYHSLHNICPAEESRYPIHSDTLRIDKTLHLQQVSDVLNISMEDLRNLNPQYQKDIIPADYKSYSLCLPSRRVSDFIKNEKNIYSHKTDELLAHRKTVEVEGASTKSSKSSSSSSSSSSKQVTRTHKVRKGESLGVIAKKYGTTVAQLKRLNNLKSNNLSIGKVLVVSRKTVAQKTTTPKEAPKPTPTTENVNTKILAENKPTKEETKVEPVVVSEPNDFFSNYYKQRSNASSGNPADQAIAKTNLTTSQQVAASQNNKSGENPKTIYHKVRIGETITQIANKYNVSTKDILIWNKLSSAKANIGQQLLIKLPGKNNSSDLAGNS